jgi:hypothetical protein
MLQNLKIEKSIDDMPDMMDRRHYQNKNRWLPSLTEETLLLFAGVVWGWMKKDKKFLA